MEVWWEVQYNDAAESGQLVSSLERTSRGTLSLVKGITVEAKKYL